MAGGEIYRVEIPIIIDDQTDKPLQQAERKISRFEQSVQKTNERIRRLFGREIKLRIGAIDKAWPVIKNVQTRLRSLTGRAWNITLQAKDKVSGIIRGISGGIRKIGGLLTSPLTLLGVGGGIGGLTKLGIDMVVERENITMAFETLLGSADAAKQRIEELTEFAGQTPFMRDEIYEASRILEVFTRGALSTSKGLKLVGDVAAGTGQDYKDVALWIGRLYDAMASGRPVGLMTARLQEMGAISGEQRAILEQLAKSGKDIAYIWPEAEKVFSRFEGQMERMSKGLGNMLTSVKSFFRETVLLRWGKGIEAELRPLLERFRQWRREHPEQVQAIGDKIERIARTGMRRIVDFVKKGYGMIADIISDESLTWSQKISAALDRILEAITAWLKGPGGEAIKETGEILGNLLAAGLEGAIPNIVPIAIELGKTLGRAVVEGIYEAIKASPWAGILLGAYIGFQIAGPKGAAIGAGIGAATWGLPKGFEALGKHIPGTEYYIRERIAEYERAEQMFEELKAVTPPGEPLFPGTELRAMPKRAIGGIYSRPHTALVAEAGPEAIIPLSARMRARALALYEETGKRLGVRPYADGGFAGVIPESQEQKIPVSSVPSLALPGPATINLNFDLTGLVRQVVIESREDIDGAVDKIADAIANNLRAVFQNMTKNLKDNRKKASI